VALSHGLHQVEVELVGHVVLVAYLAGDLHSVEQHGGDLLVEEVDH